MKRATMRRRRKEDMGGMVSRRRLAQVSGGLCPFLAATNLAVNAHQLGQQQLSCPV